MKNFINRVSSTIVGNLFTLILFGLVFFVVMLVFSSLSFFGNKDKKLIDNSILEITLNEPIKESSMEHTPDLFSLNEQPNYYLIDYLRAIETAKDDEKIKGISLKLKSFDGGFTQMQDIRKALVDFKESGKFIYAYLEEGTQGAYYLSTVADSIYQHPMGAIELKGLSAEVMFFKNMGEKFGIDFQVIRHGDYKSAVEPFLRDDISPENREQLSLILDGVWNSVSSSIIDSRGLTKEQLNIATDSLVALIPKDALKNKLIDKISTQPEYDHIIANKIDLELEEDENFYEEYKKHLIGFDDYLSKQKVKSEKDRVAVLYASGEIVQGNGYEGIQSETYIKAIRKIKNNEKVKAVVFRINSGGGSAFASDEILAEVKLLHEEKPVMVSFGDVAASGGYYIAMESDSIFAQPTTITGSIGVLGMLPNFKGMANDLGVTTDYVNTHTNSNFLKSPLQPLSESAKGKVENIIGSVYDRFVMHVMNGRGMTYEQVDSIGGGRVWLGVQAKENGLIDAYGNLNDAIKAAAKKADLEEGEYSLTSYPFKKEGFEEILKQYQVNSSTEIIKEHLGDENYALFERIKAMKNAQGVQVRVPFNVHIE